MMFCTLLICVCVCLCLCVRPQAFRVSPEECSCLHEEVQLLLLSVLQTGAQQRMEEQRVEALLAHVHTQLELLRGPSHTHTQLHTSGVKLRSVGSVNNS